MISTRSNSTPNNTKIKKNNHKIESSDQKSFAHARVQTMRLIDNHPTIFSETLGIMFGTLLETSLTALEQVCESSDIPEVKVQVMENPSSDFVIGVDFVTKCFERRSRVDFRGLSPEANSTRDSSRKLIRSCQKILFKTHKHVIQIIKQYIQNMTPDEKSECEKHSELTNTPKSRIKRLKLNLKALGFESSFPEALKMLTEREERTGSLEVETMRDKTKFQASITKITKEITAMEQEAMKIAHKLDLLFQKTSDEAEKVILLLSGWRCLCWKAPSFE